MADPEIEVNRFWESSEPTHIGPSPAQKSLTVRAETGVAAVVSLYFVKKIPGVE